MSVYSTLFFSGNVPATQTVLYTVPQAQTVVLRDLELFNQGVDQDHFNLVVEPSGHSAAFGVVSPKLAIYTWWQWQGRLVLPSTSSILGQGAAGVWSAVLSGYLLSP